MASFRPQLWNRDTFVSEFNFDEETVTQRTFRVSCDLCEIGQEGASAVRPAGSHSNPEIIESSDEDTLDLSFTDDDTVDASFADISELSNSYQDIPFDENARDASDSQEYFASNSSSGSSTPGDAKILSLVPSSAESDITPSRYPKIRRKKPSCSVNLLSQLDAVEMPECPPPPKIDNWNIYKKKEKSVQEGFITKHRHSRYCIPSSMRAFAVRVNLLKYFIEEDLKQKRRLGNASAFINTPCSSMNNSPGSDVDWEADKENRFIF